jgi:hypothetical protein
LFQINWFIKLNDEGFLPSLMKLSFAF